jgi:CubicO group peptidase (beta-lactamase class C family)
MGGAGGQTPVPELRPGKPVEQELRREQTHRYRVRLRAGEMMQTVVDQRGIDVVVRVLGPDGRRLSEVDSPNGTQGPEPVLFDAPAEGEYTVEVAPLDEGQEILPGRYEIRLVKVLKPAKSPREKVERLIALRESKGAPGAAILAIQDGKILYQRGFGLANLEYDIPITPTTVFHVASVSKQFTAFAIMLLAQQGRLSLDDDIRKHLPEMHDFGKVITIRHLIHHTSGLRDQWEMLAMAGWRLDDVITQEQIRRMAFRATDLNFPPGERFLYSNMGYTLLAEIVARVSGKSFAQFTAENIFQPLGMTNTHFHENHQRIVKNRAYSYAPAPGGYRLSALNYANVGATSLFTTAEDLGKWLMNFETAKVGGKAVIARMMEDGRRSDGRALGYGGALSLGTHRGLKVVGHNGADAGYRSAVSWYPEQRFGVVVLSNVSTFNPDALADGVADAFLAEKFTPETARPAATPPAPASSDPAPPTIPASLLKEYEGLYEEAPGRYVRLSVLNSHLMYQPLAASSVQTGQRVLRPESESRFRLGTNIVLTFERGTDGNVSGVQIGTQSAKRIAFPLPPAELAQYEGVYYSPELDTAYTLRVRDGRLTAEHPRNPATELTPQFPDGFQGNQWYFSRVHFDRDKDGKITGLTVHGGRVLNLKFQRRP